MNANKPTASAESYPSDVDLDFIFDAARYNMHQDFDIYEELTKVLEEAYPKLFPKSSVENPECDHEWNNYVGLIESYNYCVKCDVKQR